MGQVNPATGESNFCCINIMLSEAEALGGVAPSLEMRDAGTVRALYSDVNGGPMMVIQDGKEKPAAESSRKAKIKYSTKVCSTGTTTPITKCSLGTTPADEDPFKFSDVEITGVYNWKVILDDTLIRTMCENRVEFYNKLLRNKVDAAIQGLNIEMAKQAVALMGKYALSGEESLTDPITLPVISAAGVPNPAALALIKTAYRKMNQGGNIITVGAGNFDLALNALYYAGVTDEGVNTKNFDLRNFFRDGNINDLDQFAGEGTDNILTWLAGAIRPVEYYQNSGDFVETGSVISVGGRDYFSHEYGRVDLGGVTWDMFMKRECDKWVLYFQKEFEVLGLPADAFGACQDYNYALRWAISCGALDCDTINRVTLGTTTSGAGGGGVV